MDSEVCSSLVTPDAVCLARFLGRYKRKESVHKTCFFQDFSEYGIAPRKIRTTQAFTEDVGQSTSTEKRRFAGESTADVEAIADRLSDLIRPVR